MVKVKNVSLYKLYFKILYFFIMNILIFIDFYTKKIARDNSILFNKIELFSFLNLFYVRNYGIAFSLLSSNSTFEYWLIIIISVLIIFIIFIKLYISDIYNNKLIISMLFILSGAIGNLINRIINGYVIDFIDLHIKNYHFATFNFADFFICFGVFLLFLK
ncbi:signal peptidase II [Candidatus Purcelliella pentastirinorum]|uniref:Lipoprotein signal peptidase n=1 Tax=Candidatus Purcelliella pentastirinorum TaxID=472834 RepID=A0AAX3N815_9ENTR|nr:signal peptidase II [Candidatus Purcelliella pentastirinorum]WDI78669.1 signal peptidase II [Candidatus Purcelliella pentastirinorum]WDR80720.1 signal peptidase II [Candidatus Purcelliella pentastirinorum]